MFFLPNYFHGRQKSLDKTPMFRLYNSDWLYILSIKEQYSKLILKHGVKIHIIFLGEKAKSRFFKAFSKLRKGESKTRKL